MLIRNAQQSPETIYLFQEIYHKFYKYEIKGTPLEDAHKLWEI